MYKQLEQLITLTGNDLNLVSRRFGQRTDLTSEQLEMLRILYNYEVLSQYDLTMKINKEQSIVSRWIKKLCQMGYITSKQSNKDMRCKDLMVTDKAKELVQQINEVRVALIEARCQNLTSKDIENLNQLLYKLNVHQVYMH
ncbi:MULTISPECIES: MarR family transcriptional regulator [Staphylococcus]|jgi:DNA-binding MarR family transcriptional regulator|uniref:MarR family transcriptional regulator n=2 Tax=Staphylococcus TaxID=1279 RepID=A0AAQ0LZG7_STAXY|nr:MULTISPECIES: MarR family transcriptional regulator [Staphylococcus]MBG3873666.1 MarR family transcriptional regulator [Staphylococcus xylosus]MBO3066250.1 MarR family transcriptional regulator [Staphylococcus shinii]MCA2500735.1 MarR family transcriptional regulator [Staphylococcus xylosus]MCA2501927.1 MarR family transcriptional regulator [Staphylococcus xylosus]MCE7780449.1 MarR family transcriptional regulator [Staphylococcus xylosus]